MKASFLNLALDPVEIGGDIFFGERNIFLFEPAAEKSDHAVVGDEISSDFRLGAEEVRGETADSALEGEEDIAAQQKFLERIEFRLADEHVGSDAAAAENLAAAVGELHFRGLRIFVIVKIVVERNVFVIALNQTSAGRVIARGGEREAGVFTQAAKPSAPGPCRKFVRRRRCRDRDPE